MTSDFIDQVAVNIVRRGLAVPSVFFLELHKPLAGLAGHFFQAFGPISALILPARWRLQFEQTISNPQQIEALISRIESLAKAAQ